jgi:hypothetical protein
VITRTGDIDPAADALAARIGGQSSVRIEGFGNREFDAISDTLVGQAFGPSASGEAPTFVRNPANFLSASRRTQIRETLRAARETGRGALFEFEGGIPHDDVLSFIERNAERQGVGVTIKYR